MTELSPGVLHILVVPGRDGRVRELQVVRADPVVDVTDEWLQAARAVQLICDEFGWAPVARVDGSPRGPVLTVSGSNREVVYLLREYDPQSCTWRAVWPD